MRVAIVGASGAVGQEIMSILGTRAFPVDDLVLYGSSHSAGTTYPFLGDKITVQELIPSSSFRNIDVVFTSAGAGVATTYAEVLTRHGAVVIDNSSAFRMDKDVPLVVPEVNAEDALTHPRGIIANPNCTTILLVVVLAPIATISPLRRVHVASYQSASGAGARGMAELEQQYREVLTTGQVQTISKFPRQLAYNVIPQIDVMQHNDYTKEEMKMYNETRKIMHSTVSCSSTCVRVSSLRAHSEAVWIETKDKVTVDKVREVLSLAPGVAVVDEAQNYVYPTPLDAAGKDEVLVGRIREDLATDNGIALWLTGDQLRKGAALNAVQIAEYLVAHGGI